jgi:hypothetical protein
MLEDLNEHVLKDHEKRTPYQCQHCTRSFGEVPGNIDVGCGHGRVCWPCVEMIKENPNPKCPMEDCQAIIGNDYIRMK